MTQLPLFRVLCLLALPALVIACQSRSSASGGAVEPSLAAEESVALQQQRAAQLYQMGAGFARGGDSVRAEHYLNAAIQAGYPETQALPELISVCVTAGRLRSALTYAEPRLKAHPRDIHLRYLVGTLYLGLGQAEVGRRHLETVLELAPEDARAHYTIGTLWDERYHDLAQARQHFQTYLRVAPHGEHAPEVQLWLRQHPEPLPASVLLPATQIPLAQTAAVQLAGPQPVEAVSLAPQTGTGRP